MRWLEFERLHAQCTNRMCFDYCQQIGQLSEASLAITLDWSVPCRVSQLLVIGKPMKVPKISNPSHQEIQHYLDAFIESMRGIYQRHQAAAGYPDSKLIIM